MLTTLPILKFPLGLTTVAPNALDLIPAKEGKEALFRHAMGDWGMFGAEVRQQNDANLARVGYGAYLMSLHRTAGGRDFFIYTSGERNHTSIFLAGDLRPDLTPELFDLPERASFAPHPGRVFLTPRATNSTPSAGILIDLHCREGHNDFTEEHTRNCRFGETLSVTECDQGGHLYVRTLADHSATILFHSNDAAKVRRIDTDRGVHQLVVNLFKEFDAATKRDSEHER